MVSTLLAAALPVIVAAAVTASAYAAEPWSRFRGPNGSGIATGDYPAALDPAGAAWKAPARSGKSSPVLTDTRVFLTAFEGDALYTQCFDRASGRLLWERSLERGREADMNLLNEPASISPVTDGENVYVFFRDVGLLSYDSNGELRWRTPLGPFANSMGHSASLVLAGGRIVVAADQKGGSYLAALDPANGETVWTVSREEGEGWATPAIYGDQVLTTSRGWLASHRLNDGKRLWGLPTLSPAIVASPVVIGDTVYTFGYGNEPTSDFEGSFDNRDKDGDGSLTREEFGTHAFMAGIAKYEGDRNGLLSREEYLTAARATVAPSLLFAFRLFEGNAAPRELWRYERSFIGVIPSPLVYEGVVYLIKNGGILETLDALSGEVLTRGRLRDAIGGYSASPVAGGGFVYLASEDGKISTLEAGREWKVDAVSDLAEPIFATPALSRGEIFVRTQGALYCFRKTPE